MKKRGIIFLFLASLVFIILTITASPSITLISPTFSNNSHTNNPWVFVNITSDENLNQSLLEWGNSSGFTNLSMSNNSLLNWYVNVTNLPDYSYNYTISAQNTSGNWNKSSRYFTTVDTIAPNINFTLPTPEDGTLQSAANSVYVNVSTNDTNEHSAFIDWNNGLVGWWAMDSYNSSGIYDNSTYNKFANFSGGLSTTNIVSGKRGKALEFDGINDYIETSINNNLNISGNFSVFAWIKAKQDTDAFNAIVGQYSLSGNSFGYLLYLNNGVIRASIYSGSDGNINAIGSHDLRDNNWHYVGVIFNGSKIKAFEDGNEVNSSTWTFPPRMLSNKVTIGLRRPSGGDLPFNGSIDEVMIFNRALTLQEVNASYNAGLYKLYNNFTSLNDGIYRYTAYAVDAAGNINSTTRQVTVDVPTQIYYVDATNGLDSNNGTSPDSAWKTISKVNAGNFNAGDFILFKRNEMWREQLTIPSSGFSGNPITFGAYGTGTNPVINPAEVISNWSVYSGNIYAANVTSSVTQVFVDGIFYNLSFYPNTGFLTTTSDSGKLGLVDANLTLTANQIINSTVKVMTSNWAIEGKTASAYNDTLKTINWTSSTIYNVASGYGYYLENKSWMLDSAGEWWYNSSSSQIYIWLQGDENPDNHNIEVSNQSYGIYAQNKANLQIANLTLKQTKGDSLRFENVNNSVISNLDINDSGSRFAYADNSRNLTLENINGYRAREDGFRFTSSDNLTIISNSLYHLGTVGKPIRSLGGVYMHWVNNTLFQYNSLYDMGYIGIWITGKDNLIDKNIINRTCVNLDDCGSIDTQLSNLSANTISNNIFMDSIGSPPMKKAGITNEAAGIYLDDFTSKFQVINNTLINTGRGIFLHNSFNNTVIDNTVFNARMGAIYFQEDTNSPIAGITHDNNISNNIFHVNSTSADYSAGIFLGLLGSTDFGSFDNNYYAHPHLDNLAIKVLNVSLITTWFEYIYSYLPLYLWQQQSGQDIHSYDMADFYQINNDLKSADYGDEKIINSNFNNDVNNWGQYPVSIWTKERASDCPIGNGSCLLALHNDSESLTHDLYSTPFPIVEGQQYEVKFKIRSNATTSVLSSIRRNGVPYDDLGFRIHRLILGNETINYSGVFTGTENATGRLDIEFAINGTVFWLDDVSVREISNVVSNNQSDDFLLLYNTQTTSQTYNLDNSYMDLYGNTITSPVTLAPFSSQLLLAGFCNNDFVCNNKETYSTCPSDCANTATGEATTTPSSGSGSSCSYDWVCSEWYPEPCPSEGMQKRVCVNRGTCSGIQNRPSLEQECTPGSISPAEPLFDIFVNILPEDKWTLHQNETKFNVKLINKGNATTIDVHLKYWMTDENGRLIAEKQETRAIGSGDEFQIAMPIAGLDFGVYKIYVQLTYGDNQVAVAGDSFQIVRSNLEIFLRKAISFPYIFILFGSIIIILLLIILLKRTGRKTRNKKPERIKEIASRQPKMIKKIISRPKSEGIGFFRKLEINRERHKKERESRKLLRKLARQKKKAERENRRLQKRKQREYRKHFRFQRRKQRKLEREYRKKVRKENNLERAINLAPSKPIKPAEKSKRKEKPKKQFSLQEDLMKQREI